MSIEEKYDPITKKTMYAYRFMVDGQRYGRVFEYYTKTAAREAEAARRTELKTNPGGLPEIPLITFRDLRESVECDSGVNKKTRLRFSEFVKEIVGDEMLL